MIGIIDYGIGNIGSIINILKRVGEPNIILANTPERIVESEKLILPGVGSFDAGMRMLNESGLRESLDRHVKIEKKPLLGICLGMQMLGTGSEEGDFHGLGYVDMVCSKFTFEDRNYKIPHMGWDYVEICDKRIPLVAGIENELRFYFVHSYYAICQYPENVLMTCDYGGKFAAAVCNGNVYGTQFHPEKSHQFGMQLLANYVKEC